MRRFRFKFTDGGEDLMVVAQLKCGCIFGQLETSNTPCVILCEEHSQKELKIKRR